MEKTQRRHGVGEEVETVKRLHEIVIKGDVASLVELLDKHPLLLHQITLDYFDSETPLHVAALLGHTDVAKEILKRNGKLALELDGKGYSPLHLASAEGYIEIVKMLLEIDAPGMCKLRDVKGRTALHVAAMKGQDEVLELLIHANHASTQILTHRGETILHIAVKHNRLDTLKLLLTVGEVSEILNCKDIDGNTVLHLAMVSQQTETIKYLVGGSISGLDVNVRNNNGLTALEASLLASQSPSCCNYIETAKLHSEDEAIRGLNREVTKTTNLNNNEKEKDDWMKVMENALMVVASVLASMAFQAGLNPPGGVWQESKKYTPDEVNYFAIPESERNTSHFAGESIMGSTDDPAYQMYLAFNTISFISSIGIILLLISGFCLRRKFFVWTLMAITWIACLSTVLTYCVSLVYEMHYTTDFEDKITLYALIIVSAFVGFILIGNFLRFIVWLVRNRVQVKEAIAKKFSKMKGRIFGPSSSLDEPTAPGV